MSCSEPTPRRRPWNAVSYLHRGHQCTAESHPAPPAESGPAPTWWGCERYEGDQFICIYRLPEGASAETYAQPPATAPEREEVEAMEGFLMERGPSVIIYEHDGPQCSLGSENRDCEGYQVKYLSCQPGLNGYDCAHRD